MELLETTDRMETVLAFYQENLKASAAKIAPSTTEEKRDGRRVVRLSMPRDDGGLQTVEVSEDTGKTTIQLMNVNSTKSAPLVPPSTRGGTMPPSSLLPLPPTDGPSELPPPPRL